MPAGGRPVAPWRRRAGNVVECIGRYLTGKCIIEIIDLLVNQKLVRDGGVITPPAAVGRFPPAIRKVAGDLFSRRGVLPGLEFLLPWQMQ